MSNNSDFAATMYECNPAVAALNMVPGFDPLKLMNRKRTPGAERDERYLDFRYKKLWFRLAHKRPDPFEQAERHGTVCHD